MLLCLCVCVRECVFVCVCVCARQYGEVELQLEGLQNQSGSIGSRRQNYTSEREHKLDWSSPVGETGSVWSELPAATERWSHYRGDDGRHTEPRSWSPVRWSWQAQEHVRPYCGTRRHWLGISHNIIVILSKQSRFCYSGGLLKHSLCPSPWKADRRTPADSKDRAYS